MGKVNHFVALLAFAILLAATALSPAADKLWTGAVSTDWFEPNNWDPPGVPLPEDIAFVKTNNVVYLGFDVVLTGLNLDGFLTTLDGPGNLTVTNFNWTNGILKGSGICTIPAGGTLWFPLGDRKDLHRNVLNFGTVIQDDGFLMTATFHNGGMFDMRGDVNITAGSFQSLFKNAGIFSKSTGLRTNTISVPFENRGEMRLLSGTLRLTGFHTNHGSVTISESAAVELRESSAVIGPSCSLEGSGTLRFLNRAGSSSTTVHTTNPIHPRLEIITLETHPAAIGSPTIIFNSAVTIRECFLDGGGISGTNPIIITNFVWTRGLLSGGGTLLVPGGGSLVVSGAGTRRADARTLVNLGAAEWRDAGVTTALLHDNKFVFFNRGTLRASGGGALPPFFINEGSVIRAEGTGMFSMSFITNRGLIEVQTGTLFLDGYQETGGDLFLNGGNIFVSYGTYIVLGGTVRGSGSFTTSYGPENWHYYALQNYRGNVSPGDPFGVLTINGSYRQTGKITIEIGGRTPGIDFDQLAVTQVLNVEGLLNIVLANGFQPVLGDRFEIVTFNPPQFVGRRAPFMSLQGTRLDNGLVMLPEYSPTNLVLVVTNAPSSEFYVVRNLAGPNRHHVRFHGWPPTNYVLQASTTLTNWVDVFPNNEPIDMIDYSHEFWRDIPYRFFRIRWGE